MGTDSRRPRSQLLPYVFVAALLALAAACGGSDHATPNSTTTAASAPTAVPATTLPNAVRPGAVRSVCGNVGTPPQHYQSVVVFAFENRTWSAVGGPGFGSEMPYLSGLADRCAWFPDWSEGDAAQNSLSQYVAQVTGAPQPGTVNDCEPSIICSTTADSIFRQARRAGLDAVNYVEGAPSDCSAAGNAAKHVPALYLWGADDRAACNDQVRSFRDFDIAHLPAFAFVTPTLCNDGHDCGNDVVDRWARTHIQPVLQSPAYRAGRVAVFVWYDEDHPVPNLWMAPTARAGPIELAGAGYAPTLRAWESMLGLPCLAHACDDGPDMRAAAHA